LVILALKSSHTLLAIEGNRFYYSTFEDKTDNQHQIRNASKI